MYAPLVKLCDFKKINIVDFFCQLIETAGEGGLPVTILPAQLWWSHHLEDTDCTFWVTGEYCYSSGVHRLAKVLRPGRGQVFEIAHDDEGLGLVEVLVSFLSGLEDK